MKQRRGGSKGRPAARAPQAPGPSAEISIEKPIYGGAFLARMEGKAVFVPLALPGEQVRARIVESRKGWAAAEAEEILAPSPERVEPLCSHFGLCGGCSYQHTGYENQLYLKEQILRETLDRAGVDAPERIEVLSGNPWRSRNRVRLAFDAAGRWGYRGRRSHGVVPIADCPIAAPLLMRAAGVFAAACAAVAPGLGVSELALFTDSAEQQLLATVAAANAPSKTQFERLARVLKEQVPELSGLELTLAGPPGEPPRRAFDWGAESIAYSAAGFAYRVDHGAFFQVNRWLVDWLVERVTAGRRGRLAWDLFAGVGLFARRLAASFERVRAVEIAEAAWPGLEQNLRETNGEPVRAGTAEFLARRAGKEQPDFIVVDPPRTGLGPEICALLGQAAAPQMVYVSCDPATLARDLKTLAALGYAVDRITLADLFPQTFHLETVVDLRRA